ncbi:MAG: hypothetical protein ACR2LY_01010 [Thermoleophilaceae bacterium]
MATRLLTGRLPDRLGAARTAVAAGAAEALGLVLIALAGGSWPLAGAVAAAAGYPTAFLVAAACAVLGALVSTYPRLRWTKRPA